MLVDGEKLYKKVMEYFRNGLCGLDTKDNFVEMIRKSELDIQPPARIEAAIRKFDKPDLKDRFYVAGGCADLCRYFLGQPQDTWKPEDFGLKPETNTVIPPKQRGG